MRSVGRFGLLAASLVALSSVASGYYHWTFFAQRTGALTPMRLQFDLKSLPGQTVSFFIAKSGPSKMVDGDSFTALTTQLRRAAETWNVETSALKVKFGGYANKSFSDVLAEQVTPGIDVVFDDDLPPGVLALSEPLTYTDLKYLGDKSSPGFAPILRSRLQLASDLAVRKQASYSDAFFGTLVHEFGHTLGLQHSMTGSAMSTSITRGTSKAAPLTADDVAAISVLYPTPEFRVYNGSISGKVNVAGIGANLASVVALGADGTAVGAMTQPDGSYRIDGLPPGSYVVYTHPLPPAQVGEANPAGIVPPVDLDRAPFLAAAPFETRFFPGTTDPDKATKITVEAARTITGVDFNVQPAAGSGIYNLRLFGYLGANRDQVVHAPPVPVGFRDWLAVQANGIVNSGQIVPGLKLSVIGDAAKLEQNTLRNFPGSDQFLLIVGNGLKVDRATSVAVLMSTDTDLYVLPNAFSVVPSKHPALTGITSYTDFQGRAHAVITGENIQSSTRVLFDGVDSLSMIERRDGRWDVEAPSAAGDYSASVELLGVDGQTFQQLLSDGLPPKFVYPYINIPAQTLSPGEISVGTSGLALIESPGADFVPGKVAVGLGSSDVAVREVRVVNRSQLWVSFWVNPKAKLGTVPVTIAAGLQLITDGPGLQLRPFNDKQVQLFSASNEATGFNTGQAGATVVLETANLPEDLSGWSLAWGSRLAPIVRGSDRKIRSTLPQGLGIGNYVLRLLGPSGAGTTNVFFRVEDAPPVILSLTNPGVTSLTAIPFLRPGDRISLTVRNLAEQNGSVNPSQIEIRLSGLKQRVDVFEDQVQPGVSRLEFIVTPGIVTGDGQPLTVGVGTRVSSAFAVGIVSSGAKDELPVE